MLDKYINEYTDYLSSEGKSERTINKYKPCLIEMIDYMKFDSLEDINDSDFISLKSNWINKKKEEGLGNQSLNLRIASAKGFMKYLSGKRLIKYNIANDLKAYNISPKENIPNADKVQEIRTFVKDKYIENPTFLNLRNYFIVNFLLATGLRNEELRKLNIDSINRKDGKFYVIGKRGIKKEGYLNADVLSIYNEYLDERLKINAKDDALFLSKNKSRISSKGLENIITNICEEMGIPHMTVHDLRHICATAMIESGVQYEVVSKLLGHTSKETLYKFYLHISDDSKKQAVEKNKIFN